MPLEIFVLRTHRRQVLNCRIEGTEVDMALDRVVLAPHLMVEVWKMFRRSVLFVQTSANDSAAFASPRSGMASTRISAPMRGVGSQLGRLSVRHDAQSVRSSVCTNFRLEHATSNIFQRVLCTRQTRSITTSTSSRASILPFTTSTSDHDSFKPVEEQTVLATIHRFPSLEPLRFEAYPANHLYLPTRKDLLHRAVVYEGDMTRSGTASTKTRYEVHGSRRKIRPQKGTGHARLGDKKSPMLRGGGVAFGPKPRDFATGLQKKVYDLAWRTALSYRFRKGELIIVDNAIEIESPSTQLLNDVFKHQEKLRGKGRSLFVTLEERPLLEDALDQLERGEQTLTWTEVDVKNILELSRIIIERDALHNLLTVHEEDLTHVSITPWHKSLIRSSPVSDLEEMIGWTEFRDLQLLDSKTAKEARPAAFESVASQRYAHAESLPEGPQRKELTIAAYEMLASAKDLDFEQLTGKPLKDYTQAMIKDGEGDQFGFPAWQRLEYQRSLALKNVDKFSAISDLENEKAEMAVAEIELQQLEMRRQASLLAAQSYEHAEVALQLQGQETDAEEILMLASAERTNVDDLSTEFLDKKIGLVESRSRVALAQQDESGQREALVELELLHAERAELAAQNDVPEVVEEPVEELVVEEPNVKDTKKEAVEAKK